MPSAHDSTPLASKPRSRTPRRNATATSPSRSRGPAAAASGAGAGAGAAAASNDGRRPSRLREFLSGQREPGSDSNGSTTPTRRSRSRQRSPSRRNLDAEEPAAAAAPVKVEPIATSSFLSPPPAKAPAFNPPAVITPIQIARRESIAIRSQTVSSPSTYVAPPSASATPLTSSSSSSSDPVPNAPRSSIAGHRSDNDIYTVEEILEYRFAADGTLMYKIKWEGFPLADSTWEPINNIHVSLINEFHHRHGPVVRPDSFSAPTADAPAKHENAAPAAASSPTENISELVGVPGATAMLLLLPLLLNFFWYSCNDFECGIVEGGKSLWENLSNHDVCGFFEKLFPLPTLDTLRLLGMWLGLQWSMHIIFPGEIVDGSVLPYGDRLKYKINGLASFLATIGLFAASVHFKWWNPSIVFSQFGPLLVTYHIFAYLLSLYLYVSAWFKPGKDSHPTGNVIVDYFHGREMNPRLFNWISFDYKFFFEGRALIMWVLIDYCFAFHQFETVGKVLPATILVCAFHTVYVLHYFVYESNVLSMIDFTAENMGWMLGWGNIVWVPFYYCIPALYAVTNPGQGDLEWWQIAVISTTFLFGYWMFAGANTQKHSFRRNPNCKIWGQPAKVMETSKGRGLLLSGWWGMARHMNYTGDIIMAISFGLPCLFTGPMPFAYAAFLTTLLVQRERRDEAWCRSKYGADWDRYSSIVQYRMVPFVY